MENIIIFDFIVHYNKFQQSLEQFSSICFSTKDMLNHVDFEPNFYKRKFNECLNEIRSTYVFCRSDEIEECGICYKDTCMEINCCNQHICIRCFYKLEYKPLEDNFVDEHYEEWDIEDDVKYTEGLSCPYCRDIYSIR